MLMQIFANSEYVIIGEQIHDEELLLEYASFFQTYEKDILFEEAEGEEAGPAACEEATTGQCS